jgi:glycosyltransferase involved in cell wall biosynthesis
LVLIGNWNNSSFGLNLRKKYKNFKNIFLLDPIYNQNKLDQLRSNCYVYIHGHSAGGTNPSLVEAMYLELPIFTFDVKYNKYTTNNNAKYFSSKEDLVCLLDEMNDNDLSVIAKKMKEISILHYNWRKIADKYSKLF